MENEIIENEELVTTDSEIAAQEIQESSADTSEQFYPTMEQYFLTPFLLCILIVMLFLKWCFPMKGGKSL